MLTWQNGLFYCTMYSFLMYPLPCQLAMIVHIVIVTDLLSGFKFIVIFVVLGTKWSLHI